MFKKILWRHSIKIIRLHISYCVRDRTDAKIPDRATLLFYNIKIGDEVGFVEEDGEYKIIPILKMEDLIDPSHFESTKKLIDEMRKERDNEA